jgi:hypothetical protein
LKRIALWFLTVVYFLAFSQPYLPFVQYALNKNFIASEWCVNKEVENSNCQGRCYLNSALSQSMGNDSQETAPVQTEVLSLAPHGPHQTLPHFVNPVYCWVAVASGGTYTPPFAGLISPPPQA